jgi:hypothetical protein
MARTVRRPDHPLRLGPISDLGAVIALQITQLAEDLPTYEANLRTKISALGAGSLTSGALERASGTLKDLQEEITKAGPAAAPVGQRPVLVEVRQPEPRGLESIVGPPAAFAAGNDRIGRAVPDLYPAPA